MRPSPRGPGTCHVFFLLLCFVLINYITRADSITLADMLNTGQCTISTPTTCSINSTTKLSGTYDGGYEDMLLIGTPDGNAVVQLTPEGIHVNPNCIFNLTRVTITNVAFESSSGPGKSLKFTGIRLGEGAQLVIANATINIACSDWLDLRNAICDEGTLYGSAKVDEVDHGRIFVEHFDSGDVVWDFVAIPYPSTCNPRSGSMAQKPTCATRMIHMGDFVEDALREMQSDYQTVPMPPPAHTFLLLSGYAVLPSNFPSYSASYLEMWSNITILGIPQADSAPAELDIHLMYKGITGAGCLKLQNLVLVNMPSSPKDYPKGLLTSLPWYMGFEGHSLLSLVLQNVTLVVPDDELEFVRQQFDSPGSPIKPEQAPGMPRAPVPPVYMAGNSSQAFLVNMSVPFANLHWEDVIIAGSSMPLTSQRLVPMTGLGSYLMLPDERGSFSLDKIVPLDSPVQVSKLATSTHFIMTDSLQMLDVSPPNQTASVQSSSVIVGNPPDLQMSVLDMKQAIPRASGYITIGGPGSHAGCTLYLRSMTLINLQPAGTLQPISLAPSVRRRTMQAAPVPEQLAGQAYSADGRRRGVSAVGTKYYQSDVTTGRKLVQAAPSVGSGDTPENLGFILGNFTSLLWLFNLNRNGSPSAAGALGNLVLENVNLVLPSVELEVLRLLLQNKTANISQQAAQRLQKEIQADKLSYELLGNDTDPYSLLNGDSAQPGDILFYNLSWFGIYGVNVTFTSQPPPVVSTPGAPVTAAILLPALPPPPREVPRARNPPSLESPDNGNEDVKLNEWQLALVIVGAVVLTAALVTAIAGWIQRRRNLKYNLSSKLEGSPGPSLANAFGGPDSSLDLNQHPGAAIKALESEATTKGSRSSRRQQQLGHIQTAAGGMPLSPRGPDSSFRDSPFSNARAAAIADSALTGSGPYTGGSSVGLLLSPNPTGSVEDSQVMIPPRDGTEKLLATIFQSEDAMDGRSYSPTTSTSSVHSTMLPPGAARNDPDEPRRQVRRKMEELREELSGGESQWQVQSQLGKGAFGVVYKGIWRGLEVAIKRIIFQVMSNTSDEVNRKTALHEAAINATLDHPNIVPTYTYDMRPLGDKDAQASGSGVTDWEMYIIQEFCDGGSLFDAIQERRFHDPATGVVCLRQILGVAANIASGCAYIHSKHIIHGDLKPDNVLLKLTSAPAPVPAKSGSSSSNAGNSQQQLTLGDCSTLQHCIAKVADFGMSMNIRNNSHISGVCHGTPLYISPEILKSGTASKSADVYSFGVMMWELLHGTSAWQHLIQALGQAPKRGGRHAAFYPGLFSYDDTCVLPAWAQLGRRCLSENPAMRPTFEEIVQALAAMRADMDRQPVQGSSSSDK